MKCPHCRIKLKPESNNSGLIYTCPICAGSAMNLGLAKDLSVPQIAKQLWNISNEKGTLKLDCPFCSTKCREISISSSDINIHIDLCHNCQTIWFDSGELDQIGIKKNLTITSEPESHKNLNLPQEVRKEIALIEVKRIKEKALSEQNKKPPESFIKTLLGILGFPIKSNSNQLQMIPWATWIIFLICIFTYCIARYVGYETILNFAFTPYNPLKHGGITLLTSIFIHISLTHLFGNMYYLILFGEDLEDAVGSLRLVLLFLSSCMSGYLLHSVFDPRINSPLIGASAGISGIMSVHAMHFPRVGLKIYSRMLRRWYVIPTKLAVCLWILFQIFLILLQIEGRVTVSALAHIGGVIGGIGCWLIFFKPSKNA